MPRYLTHFVPLSQAPYYIQWTLDHLGRLCWCGVYPPAIGCGVYPPAIGCGVYPPAIGCGVYPPAIGCGVYPPAIGCGVYPPAIGCGVYPPAIGCGVYPPAIAEPLSLNTHNIVIILKLHDCLPHPRRPASMLATCKSFRNMFTISRWIAAAFNRLMAVLSSPHTSSIYMRQSHTYDFFTALHVAWPVVHDSLDRCQ